jgi:hypothetical protein
MLPNRTATLIHIMPAVLCLVGAMGAPVAAQNFLDLEALGGQPLADLDQALKEVRPTAAPLRTLADLADARRKALIAVNAALDALAKPPVAASPGAVDRDVKKLTLCRLTLQPLGRFQDDLYLLFKDEAFLKSIYVGAGTGSEAGPTFNPTMLFDILVTQAEGDAPYILRPLLEGIDVRLADRFPNKKVQSPLGVLFPTLSLKLKADVIPSATFLDDLRALGEADLRALPEHLLSLAQQEGWLSSHADIVPMMAALCEALTRIRSGEDPIATLGNLADAPANLKEKNLAIAIRSLGEVCQVAHAIETGLHYTGGSRTSRTAIKFFDSEDGANALTIVVQRALAVKGYAQDPAGASKADPALLENLFAVLTAVDNLRTLTGRIQTAARTADTQAQFALQYLQACLEVVKTTQKLAPKGQEAEVQKDYSTYIQPLFQITGDLTAHEYLRMGKDLVAYVRGIMGPERAGKEDVYLDDVEYLLGLTGPIAAATDQASLDKAIKAALTPPGTFTLKRQEDAVHLFLNGYLGLAAGKEFFRQGGGQTFFTSLAVPVGIECSWGGFLSPWIPQSVGFLIAPIDLGGLAQVRYKSNYQSSSVSWQDVRNPAVYLIFGLTRNYAITIGLGARYQPDIQNPALGSEVHQSIQAVGFIAWDVPLVNLLPRRH